ncbi:CinA family protein [Phenylobacterium sp.]|uniref:CinA family protein n=1 Tax=Phenylobacterium sp. TaxID=1871053 RepID=UPI0027300A16|nr:CinA family protein [Phenylobacterium sp.]MDP2215090.1 CinA family protein [Phenylobacterium sp.]
MTEALALTAPRQIENLAEQVLKLACDRDVKLATAESCTGGMLAALLTDIPGCSHAFERGFVVYTDEAKHELLGVSQQVLAEDGAVSEAAAIAMVEGALARSRAGVVVAITGYTDPGPKPEEEAGLVHFAAARSGCGPQHRMVRFGALGRDRVREGALEIALQMMRQQLEAP